MSPSSEASEASEAPARADDRPNIVVIMADDMRVDDLLFMPRTRSTLVRNGVEFENSFSPNPLCCPARASFLTGRYSHNHKVFSHVAPWGFGAFDDRYTLATALKASGYNTALVGKYLNGYGVQRSAVTKGPSLHYVPRGYTDWYAALDTRAGSPLGSTYNYRHVSYNHNGRIDAGHRGEYSTTGIGRIARRLIDGHARGDRPFFLLASFVAPHFGGPREPDDPADARVGGTLKKLGTPARPTWVRGRFDRLITRSPGLPRGGGPSEADMSDKPRYMRDLVEPDRRLRRGILESARQRAESLYVLDIEVGRLVRTLKASKEWDNTVLVFTSDNGYFLGEHREPEGKGKPYEPATRVPLLITGPGLRTGEKRYDPITTIDLTATLLDLGNATGRLTAHHQVDGKSKWPILKAGDQGWIAPVVTEGFIWRNIDSDRARKSGFADRNRSYIGIRTARYSYVRYIRGDEELYDLSVDANQMRSMHRDPRYAEVRRTLRATWSQYKDCRGASCRAPLAPDLQADPEQERALTRSYWRQVAAVYSP